VQKLIIFTKSIYLRFAVHLKDPRASSPQILFSPKALDYFGSFSKIKKQLKKKHLNKASFR
jgi:hypothetical protein